MQSSGAPTKITLAFAASGTKHTIPVASQASTDAALASYTDGFPAATMTKITSGGVPPYGQDFNGILNAVSGLLRYYSAGAILPWDSTFAADTNAGGYPKGALVLDPSNLYYWASTAENNTTTPGATGASWALISLAGAMCASAKLSADVTTSSAGANKVAFNIVDFDSYSLFSATNGRFTAPASGKYRISGALSLPAANPQNYIIDAYVNGALSRRMFELPQVSDVDLCLPFDSILNLSSDDHVEIYLTGVQSAVTIGHAYSFAQFTYVGN